MQRSVLKEIGAMMEEFSGKRYHVVGIGRSGVAAANLLKTLGADVGISDKNNGAMLGDYIQGIVAGIDIFSRSQGPELIDGIDCLVLSPGVPADSGMVTEARRRSVEVIGEIELAYRVFRRLADRAGFGVGWYGITGTNGKSTTATLLYEMLKKSGGRCVLAGNIGNPLSGEALNIFRNLQDGALDISSIDIVLELSSFQLETVTEFRLDISALLNITDDHLDRYEDFHHYSRAKGKIFINQGEGDYAVINADDETVLGLLGACGARKLFVSAVKEVDGAYIKAGKIYFKTASGAEESVDVSEIRIVGTHNIYNAATASLMASLAGISEEDILSALKEFPGLEHRLEFAGEIEGVTFYNDSKGTNVGAVIKSLESFDGGVVLIAGGRDKNGDFSLLVPYVKDRVKKIVVIGEAADKMKEALGHVVRTEHAGTLEEAVAVAYGTAEKGDTVLLSPACASFDMFQSFEDRGERFKNIVSRYGVKK